VDTYYETLGPCLYNQINDIHLNKRSFLIKDKAILHCLERVKTLGF
ncbi:nucleoside triphosphatase YtkD, partial [Bacillus thuringiensis]|nr:nucleoside triphosphatase YtkD [Bacillus thuringiensis]